MYVYQKGLSCDSKPSNLRVGNCEQAQCGLPPFARRVSRPQNGYESSSMCHRHARRHSWGSPSVTRRRRRVVVGIELVCAGGCVVLSHRFLLTTASLSIRVIRFLEQAGSLLSLYFLVLSCVRIARSVMYLNSSLNGWKQHDIF